MRQFLQTSGAISFGLLIAGAFAFPVLAIGAIFGWLFIGQHIEENNDE